jgi:hypothetical protein
MVSNLIDVFDKLKLKLLLSTILVLISNICEPKLVIKIVKKLYIVFVFVKVKFIAELLLLAIDNLRFRIFNIVLKAGSR